MASRPAPSKRRQPTEHDADDMLRHLLRTPPADSADDEKDDRGDRT